MVRPPVTQGGRRVDLHSHTCFSDGAHTPEELVALALRRGLAALAVTDHDTVESLPYARAAAGTALELVPGIELSSAEQGMDLHILGYYLDPEHPELGERLARFRRERRERALAIVERLEGLGAAVDVEDVFDVAGPGVVGRPHVAEALVRAGHVGSVEDAFRRFLSTRGPAYVPRPAFRPEEAIALIHEAQGVSALAHPGNALAESVVERLAEAGLRGLEVWHPQHGPATVRRYRALAARLGLLETGGTDFHGGPHGIELGEISVPMAMLTALKRAAGVAA